jgi:uncharacterized protein (TIGR02147 family)
MSKDQFILRNMDMQPSPNALSMLQERINFLCKKNPAFSLRAFAKQLQTSPGSLSEIMRGRRPLTAKNAQKIARHLFSDQAESVKFIVLAKEHGKRTNKALAKKEVDKDFPSDVDELPPTELSAQILAVMTDATHFYLLALMRTDDFKSDARWIAKRLKKNPIEIQTMVTRLKNLGLIKAINGRLVRTDAELTTTHDIPSKALRDSHKQSMREAMDCLDTLGVDQRDVTSMTIVIDPKRLPEAKKYLRDFRRQFTKVMEIGPKIEVYNLNIQLVPVTEVRSSHERCH